VVHEYYELPYADHGYDFNWNTFQSQISRDKVKTFVHGTQLGWATRAGMELLTNSNSKDRFWHKTDVGRIVFRGPVAAGKRTSLISAYNVR
jgi:hypothetical protein